MFIQMGFIISREDIKCNQDKSGLFLMRIKWINTLNRKFLKISFKAIGQGVSDMMQRLKIL